MKRILLALVLSALAGAIAGAAPLACILETLKNYDVPGFTCTEGGLLFSDFSFTHSGSVALDDSAVEVVPLGDGFDFDAPFTAGAGMNLDVILRYTVRALNGSFFTSDTLAMAGFGVSGTGAIDIAETICVGAPFTAGGVCPTSVAMLNVFDNSGGFQASSSVTFGSSPTVLGATKDIAIAGGNGSASTSLVDNQISQFSAPPVSEPGTWIMMGGGVVAYIIGLVFS